MAEFINSQALGTGGGGLSAADKAEILAAISASNSGVPGELKVVYSPTGVAPDGTVRVDMEPYEVRAALTKANIVGLDQYLESSFGLHPQLATMPGVCDMIENRILVAKHNTTDYGKVMTMYTKDTATGLWSKQDLTGVPGGSGNQYQHLIATMLCDNGYIIWANTPGNFFGFGFTNSLGTFQVWNGSSWVSRTSTTYIGSASRFAVFTFTAGNYLYSIGGGSTTTSFSLTGNATQFGRYDPVANSWTALATPPFNVYMPTSTASTSNFQNAWAGSTGYSNVTKVGNKLVFCLGGTYNTDGSTTLVSNSALTTVALYVYDINANTWSSLVTKDKLTSTTYAGTTGTGAFVATINGELYMLSPAGAGVTQMQAIKLNPNTLADELSLTINISSVNPTGNAGPNSDFHYAMNRRPVLFEGKLLYVTGFNTMIALDNYKVGNENSMWVRKV